MATSQKKEKDLKKFYRDLVVWNNAMNLVTELYSLSNRFPDRGLTLQLREAVVQIPGEIAKGNGRYHPQEYLYHLSMAHGAVYQVETFLFIARKLNYVSNEELTKLLQTTDELANMISKHIESLSSDLNEE